MANALRKLTGVAVLLTLMLAASAQARTPTRPAVSTGGAKSVTFSTATLTGAVNPEGADTSFYFQYGKSSSYGAATLPIAVGAGTSTLSVTSPVAGLVANTKYHYRIVAASLLGTSVGSDRTLTTPKIPLTLSIAALPNPTAFDHPALIEGALSGTGNGNREIVLQQNPFPSPPNGWTNVGNAALTLADGTFSFPVLSVGLYTQYRVVSVGSPVVISPVVGEYVTLAVTAHVTHSSTRNGAVLHFRGAISPAEVGARVGIERLTVHGWKNVGGTTSKPGTATSSHYAKSIHVQRGGFYRVLVLPVIVPPFTTSAYLPGYSTPMLLHTR